MSEQTKISWADSTLNFWSGCTKVSDGCKNCYAETLSNRFLGAFDSVLGKSKPPMFGGWGKGAPRQLHESAFKEAIRYNKKPWVCDECGESFEYDTAFACDCGCTTSHRRRIFSLSLGDWLDPEVPIEWLARMLDTIRQCDQVTWILCTKRPELWKERMELAQRYVLQPSCNWLADWHCLGLPPKNIILLASVENQAMADKRIPELLKMPAACRGLSLEPLLGVVDLKPFLPFSVTHGMTIPENSHQTFGGIDWLVIGGESGKNARPCNVEWIRSLVRQGKSAGVAVHVKQLGACPTVTLTAASETLGFFTHPKGGDPSEWPADLRVQEWPKGF